MMNSLILSSGVPAEEREMRVSWRPRHAGVITHAVSEIISSIVLSRDDFDIILSSVSKNTSNFLSFWEREIERERG